jgi:hypothetical protein
MKNITMASVLAMSLLSLSGRAADITDKLSIGGILAGAYQCQNLSNATGDSDTCKGGVPFQPEVSFRPTDADEVFAKFGFATGNGLSPESPFVNSNWAADLEDDVRNINGRNRDYLLTAWYKHTFIFDKEQSLGATLGIIDSTDYLDNNAYANDEYKQFMNAALTNGPNVFLPSYDWGMALEWNNGPWSLDGVLMNVGENDDGNNYNFYGLQAGYNVENRFGEGNYRLVLASGSDEFLDPSATTKESRAAVLLSFDQQLGKQLGAFLRMGWQSDDAAIDYAALYSGGVDIKGTGWNRDTDNIGLAYAHLNGGNTDIVDSQAIEAYYRLQLDHVFALTADLQYLKDNNKVGTDPGGIVAGLRVTAEF